MMAVGVLTVFTGCEVHGPVNTTQLPAPHSSQTAPATQVVPLPLSKGYSLHEKVLKLRFSRPTECGVFNVKLVSIADDGTTCIRVIETGHELTAHPGEFFEGGEFGSQGLQLVSASKEAGVASILNTFCVHDN